MKNSIGAMGCFPQEEFESNSGAASRSERGERAREEKLGNGRIANSAGFLLPCGPEEFGAAGPVGNQRRVSLRAVSNAREAASEEP